MIDREKSGGTEVTLVSNILPIFLRKLKLTSTDLAEESSLVIVRKGERSRKPVNEVIKNFLTRRAGGDRVDSHGVENNSKTPTVHSLVVI